MKDEDKITTIELLQMQKKYLLAEKIKTEVKSYHLHRVREREKYVIFVYKLDEEEENQVLLLTS